MQTRFVFFIGCFALAQLVYADGVIDGRIGQPYGSTRAIDSGNDLAGDGECASTAGRGNLIDFFAMSMSGGGSGTNDPWYFAWTVDSSHPLNSTSGDFFGNAATIRANYLIGIEVNCAGSPRLEMWQDGQPWEREFAWNVDYFIAMFPTGDHTMEAQLWRNDGGNNRSLIIGGISVTSRVVGFRRQIEFVLPATAPVPVELRNNSALCLYLLSVQAVEGSGTVLDGVGLLNHNITCPGPAFDIASLGAVFINTAPNCKTSGRPTDVGVNDRQCLSNPRRDVVPVVAGQTCSAPFGVAIDGSVDAAYALLTESSFAGPYLGGASNASDFFGESSARTYTYINPSGVATTVVLPVATSADTHGDIRNVHTFGDTNYLYVVVTGPTGLGWDNEPDRFNVFVAIDMPGQNSGNDSGGFNDLAPGQATAPASRLVNFKGWDPDHVIELVWRGNAVGQTPVNLYRATGPGTWSAPVTFTYTNVANTATAPVGRYYNRTWPFPDSPIYEFAIPWTNLARATPPLSSDVIRIGVYTTGDENIEGANTSRWDIADQAPGIGQGCTGEGCHERVGDDALDDDDLNSTGAGDRSPYVGRTYGNPNFTPATDNSTNDVDTIEEYFTFSLNIQTCIPAIDIQKTVSDVGASPGVEMVTGTNGQFVLYSFVVRNIGDVTLTNVIVTDNLIAPPLSTNIGTLVVNQARTVIASRTISGSLTNIASAVGNPPVGPPVFGTDTSVVIRLAPAIDIQKTVSDIGASPGVETVTGTNGQSVLYSFVVRNIGDVTLTNVIVTDNLIAPPLSTNIGTLVVNQARTVTAIRTISGSLTNTASAVGNPPVGPPVSATDTSVVLRISPAITIQKTVSDVGASPGVETVTGTNGQSVLYSFVVRNIGDVTLTNVVVTDNLIAPPLSTNIGTLIVNQARTVTASRTISGSLTNIASAVGNPPVGPPVSATDTSVVLRISPAITIQKTVSDVGASPGVETVTGTNGQSVLYSFVVRNIGDVTLTNVIVTDNLIAPPLSTNIGTLIVNQARTVTASRTISGSLTNIASAVGNPPVGPPVSATDTSVVLRVAPAIDIQKTVSDVGASPGVETVTGTNGQSVLYSFVVRNIGDVTLTNVIVTDNLIAPPLLTNIGTLVVNQARTVTASRTISGSLTNIASAVGNPPVGPPVSATDTSVVLRVAPAIDIQKTVSDIGASPGVETVTGTNGQSVLYSFVVRNIGDVTLTNVIVTDNLIAPPLSTNLGTLVVNQARTVTASRTISGSLTNIASAVGNPPVGPPVSATDTSVVLRVAPAIDIQKTVSDVGASPGVETVTGTNGQSVLYSFVVRNIGDVTLTNVIVTDNLIAPPLSTNIGTLVVNQARTVTASRTISGSLTNTASAVGNPPVGPPVSATDTSVVLRVAPAIDIQKTVSDIGASPGVETVTGTNGQFVLYSFVVRNIGDVTLTNVIVTDNLIAPPLSTNIGTLVVNQARTVTASRTISGSLTNTASAVGNPPVGPPVSATDTSIVFRISTGIDIEKSTNGQDADVGPGPLVEIGATVTWTFVVRNTGSVGVTNVVVFDDQLGVITNLVSGDLNANRVLETNEVWTFAHSGIAVAGPYVNLGSVTGVTVGTGTTVTDTDPSHYVGFSAGFVLSKTRLMPASDPAVVGQDIVFRIDVVNTGTVELLAVELQDVYRTNDLFFVSAIPPTDDVIDDGMLNWSNVGPVAVGASTSIMVNFVARHSTVGSQTNVVVARTDLPPGYPTLPPLTNQAPYAIDPRSGVGDYIWLDINGNGIQDPAEQGLPGIKIYLYATNQQVVGITTSDLNGAYSFTNLLPGSYYISAVFSLGELISPQFQGVDPTKDSNANMQTGMTPYFTLLPGEYNDTIDIGFREIPIYASVVDFEGYTFGEQTILRWETDSEYGTDGWFVEREDDDGQWLRNDEFLSSFGDPSSGGTYQWHDRTAKPGETYWYRLVEIEVRGGVRYGEAKAITFPHVGRMAKNMPITSFQAAPKKRITTTSPVIPVTWNQVVATDDAVKVVVKAAGLHSITFAELANLFNTTVANVTNRGVHLENLGLSIPVWHGASQVVFYARSHRSIYSDENVYRLRLQDGDFASTHIVPPVIGFPVAEGWETNVFEQQDLLRPDLFEDASEDLWLWHMLISGISSQFTAKIVLPHVVESEGGELVVRLKGGTQNSGNGMHGAQITLNGQVLGSVSFFGLNSHTVTFSIPPGLWTAGTNQIKVVTTPPPGVTLDRILIDRFVATYRKKWMAVSNQITLAAAAGPVQVGGFTSSDIELWDVTDNWQPVRLAGFAQTYSNGQWAIQFTAPRDGQYLATAVFKTPFAMIPWPDTDLKSNTQRVDYLVIHGAGLETGAMALAAHRASRGLRTKVVSMEAIYNTFNHGICDGRAIKTFLGYAYRMWEESPRYVVLAGDNSLDYMNRLGAGVCLIPTPPAGSPFGVYGSDHHVGDLDGDGQLDMAVGRIPATNAVDLAHYVAKLIKFEQNGDWRQRVMIATDKPEAGLDFYHNGNVLAAKVLDRTVNRADVFQLGFNDTSAALKNSFPIGHELTIYIGHGNASQMAQAGILTRHDVPLLNNSDKPGIVMALGCLMGTFSQSGLTSIGEKFITDQHGASALIGSAAMVNNGSGNLLAGYLVDAMYDEPIPRLGDAWVLAKNSTVGNINHPYITSYQLLGCPALAMGDVYAPRGGPAVHPQRPSYDEWKQWAFAPAWYDAGLGTGATYDPDGDGMRNWEEFIAGTDPLDHVSELVVVTVRPLPNGTVSLTWPSVPGRLYRIERTAAATGIYQPLAQNVVATAPINEWIDLTPLSEIGFYRVWVQ